MTITAKTYSDPSVDLESEPYWTEARKGRLLVKYCNECARYHFYPRAICPSCFSDDTEWHEATGRGTVYSYSIIRRASPVYAVAYVTLDEGVTILSNLVDCEFDLLRIGQPVLVDFRSTAGGFSLPVFRPTAANAAIHAAPRRGEHRRGS